MAKNKGNHLKRNNQESGKFVSTQLEQHVWTSPLPPPDVLQKYKELDPEFLNTVVDQIKIEADHRRRLESEQSSQREMQIKTERDIATKVIQERRLNTLYAFSLAFLIVICSTYLVTQGHQAIGVATLVSAIGYVFWGKKIKDSQKNKN